MMSSRGQAFKGGSDAAKGKGKEKHVERPFVVLSGLGDRSLCLLPALPAACLPACLPACVRAFCCSMFPSALRR